MNKLRTLLSNFEKHNTWLSGKTACNAGATGDGGSIPGSGRSSGEGTDYPLQYSCPENSIDREAWQATVHKVTKCQIRLRD